MNTILFITLPTYEQFEQAQSKWLLMGCCRLAAWDRDSMSYEQADPSYEQGYEQLLNSRTQSLIFRGRELG